MARKNFFLANSLCKNFFLSATAFVGIIIIIFFLLAPLSAIKLINNDPSLFYCGGCDFYYSLLRLSRCYQIGFFRIHFKLSNMK